MSSDDIFAAQMWPWPDPLLKRDAQGRILFVNAAFLRIYGGQVQDWHGNSVGGWPIPVPGPVPNRFETRLPTPQGEMIFDWIEYTLADGGTLGLGRDVTELLPAPEPDPAYRALPPQNEPPAAYQEQAPVSVALAAAPAMAAASAVAGIAAAPLAFQSSAEHNAVPQFDVPHFEPDPIDVPEVDIPQFETPETEAPQYEPPVETIVAPAEPEAPQQTYDRASPRASPCVCALAASRPRL